MGDVCVRLAFLTGEGFFVFFLWHQGMINPELSVLGRD